MPTWPITTPDDLDAAMRRLNRLIRTAREQRAHIANLYAAAGYIERRSAINDTAITEQVNELRETSLLTEVQCYRILNHLGPDIESAYDRAGMARGYSLDPDRQTEPRIPGTNCAGISVNTRAVCTSCVNHGCGFCHVFTKDYASHAQLIRAAINRNT